MATLFKKFKQLISKKTDDWIWAKNMKGCPPQGATHGKILNLTSYIKGPARCQ